MEVKCHSVDTLEKWASQFKLYLAQMAANNEPMPETLGIRLVTKAMKPLKGNAELQAIIAE